MVQLPSQYKDCKKPADTLAVMSCWVDASNQGGFGAIQNGSDDGCVHELHKYAAFGAL